MPANDALNAAAYCFSVICSSFKISNQRWRALSSKGSYVLYQTQQSELGTSSNNFAKAGLFVPITGFAHAMQSAALDYKKEGLVIPIYNAGTKVYVWEKY